MSERDLQRLLALWERTLGSGWLDLADYLRSLPANSVDAIEARLLQGDIGGLIRDVESAALTFATETQRAYTAGGQHAAQWLDAQPEMAERLIRFDASGARATLHARQNQLELVRGTTAETRENIRSALVDAARTGENPRQTARVIRDSIGLAPNQERYVANYRRALKQGDWSRALGYELSDGRSDRTIRRLQRDGGGLSAEQIDSMTERYRKNQIAWRAENIARTESARNVHAGLEESMRQAVERGDVEADQLVKEWLPGPMTRHARRGHRSSALLAQRPRFDQPFVMDDGTRKMHPGDGAGGAEHDAHCRCTYSVTLASIGKRRSTLGPFHGEGMYADIARAAGRIR